MYSRHRMVNPLLGVYYGIFTAVYIGLVVFLLILEQMGILDRHILYALTGMSFFLTVAISLAATTGKMDDFFVSGRRVPAGLNGLVLLVISIGGAGFSGLVGAVFFLGIDAFGLMFGFLAGLMIAGIFMASYVRKAGVYSVPSFIEVRYSNRMMGWIAGVGSLFPLLCFALAELSLIKLIGPMILGISSDLVLGIILIVALLVLLPGGVRSMSWAHCALAIVVILGVIIPLVIISLKFTNLPLAQMTYGSLIDDIANINRLSTEQTLAPNLFWATFLKGDVHSVSLPFLGGERVFGGLEKLLMMVVVAVGVAGMPTLLMRSGVTVGIFEARKSFAWAVALMGLLILSIPACAVFLHYMIYNPETKILMSSLPNWIADLQAAGLLSVQDIDGDGQLLQNEIKFARDGIFISLPMVAGLNGTIQSLCFAAVMAAALASFTGRVMSLGHLFSRDFHLQKSEMEAELNGQKSLIWTRVMVLLVACALVTVAYNFPLNGFSLFISGLILCGSGLFPVLFLSIWWKRMNKTGFVCGMFVGISTALACVFLTNFGSVSGPFGLSLFALGGIGIAASFLSACVGALIGPLPSEADMDVLTDIRTPGGEALYDRLLRLAMPRRTSQGN